MKKRFKYLSLLTATALTLGFTGCTSDENSDGNKVPEGQPATLNLELVDNGSKNTLGTYAAPTGTTDPATNSESNIVAANRHLYIFKADGTLEYTGADLSGISLVSGSKKVYLIANVATPSFGTFKPTVGDANATETNLLKEKFTLATPAIGDVTAANNFYISNVGSAGTVNVAPGSNNMQLKIGRGVAKVNVDMSTYTQPSTGTLSSEKYLIANNPADMFYVPIYSSNQLQTPFFNASNGASKYFNNGTLSADGITDGLKDAKGNDISYATENAISKTNVKYSTINYAIIQGIFAPKSVVDVNNTAVSSGYQSGSDFWRIQYTETVGSVTYDRGFYKAFVVGSSAPTTSSQVYKDATANGTLPKSSYDGGTVKANIVKYKGDGSTGAYCYYYLGLGDTRFTKGGQETERFTVERNQYYYYKIASVADCGFHTPIPPITIPALTSTLGVDFVTAPWGVVGGAGGLTPGI